MTEEKKRYSQDEHGLVFDALIWDSMDDVEMFQTDIVERLNTYETDITRILSDHDRLNVKCHKLESRVKELEGAIEYAIDNIGCDAMRPLIELMEGK